MLCSSQTHMLLCLDLLLRFHCRDSLILAERRAFAPVFDSPPWDPPSAFCSGCGRLPLLSSFCTFSWIWQWIREMYPVSLFLWCRWLGSPGGFFLSWWWVVISSFFPPPSSWTQTFFRANTFPKKRHQNLSAGEQNDLLLLFQLKSKPHPYLAWNRSECSSWQKCWNGFFLLWRFSSLMSLRAEMGQKWSLWSFQSCSGLKEVNKWICLVRGAVQKTILG